LKIAILTFRFPFPPNRGDRLTLLNFMKLMAPRHEVHLFALSEKPPPPEGLKLVADLGVKARVFPVPKARSLWQSALALPGKGALQLAYFRSAEMEAALREYENDKFDAVLLHSVRLLPEARMLRADRKIFMAIDTLSLALRRAAEWTPWPRRLLLLEEATRLAAAEREGAEWSDEVWMVSDVDAHYFPTETPEKLRVVRQGIGVEPRPGVRWTPDGRTLLFVGRMDVHHNVEAARRLCEGVFPIVRESMPEARVRLVGASPAPGVKRLAQLDGVEVTGSVEDLHEEYEHAGVLVAPLTFCTGVQNKILEAAAAGLPVVTTSKPAEGVGQDLGSKLWVAETDGSMAAAIVSILKNPDAARARAEQARKAVLENFSWSNMLEALEHPHTLTVS
jgi:glycosyltransferase involved in cell wall biosynthesis